MTSVTHIQFEKRRTLTKNVCQRVTPSEGSPVHKKDSVRPPLTGTFRFPTLTRVPHPTPPPLVRGPTFITRTSELRTTDLETGPPRVLVTELRRKGSDRIDPNRQFGSTQREDQPPSVWEETRVVGPSLLPRRRDSYFTFLVLKGGGL